MIHEVHEDGRVVGQVLCGNTACQKVLRTYEGEQNFPGPDDHGYNLLNVEKQLLFTDSSGRPLREMPSGNACQFLGVDVVLNLDDRIVGYTCKPGSGLYVEDFCSDRCASQHLMDNTKWNLCLRNQQGGSVLFVAHVPERFTTEDDRVEWPPRHGSDPPQHGLEPTGRAAPDTKELLFYGHLLTLNRATLARRAGEEPDMIASVTQLDLPCPLGKLHERSGRIEPCRAAIELIMDLAPSAVLCPSCFSLMFLDQVAHSSWHEDADSEWRVAEGQMMFGYATYPDHRAQDDLNRRILEYTSGKRALVAMRLDDELGQMLGIPEGRVSCMPSSCTVEELNSLLPIPSVIADFICGSAQAAYQNGRHWEAIALAQRALVIEPESAWAHFLVGTASDELGLLDSAISEYQAALRKQPRLVEAHVNLGVVYQQQGRWADALSQLQAALRINPDHAQAHFNLGVTYGRQGRVEDEIREYQAAVRINPDFAMARHNLGVTYYQQGQLEKAVRELRIAASLGHELARDFLAQIGYQ